MKVKNLTSIEMPLQYMCHMRKKLAYEIQKMHEGFYYFIQFEADAQCPAEVERHVRIMDNVLRYLVVRKDA